MNNNVRAQQLTFKESFLLALIKNQISANGYPPSIREIAKAMNVKSTSTVFGHLCELERKGYIKRDIAKQRAIKILEVG